MTFRERYLAVKSDAQKTIDAFLTDVTDATGVSEATVRQWITGTTRPNPFVRKQLEQLMGAPFSELFPDDKP